nr:hypothetical protein [Pseudoxanthomonas sp.]
MEHRNLSSRWHAAWFACLAMAGAAFGAADARAQTTDTTIVQGRLALHWGDPAPVAGPRIARPARLRAVLLADDGRSIPLDPDQAKRAAVDLYALANRRVAVSLPTRMQGFSARERFADAIVPADGLAQAAPVLGGKQVSAAAAVMGNTRWVTVMCKFSDIATEQKDKAFFTSQYGSAVGQLGHYWSEVSYGQINLAGSSAYGWFMLPKPRSGYVTTVDGKDDANLDSLFQDCVAAADAQVDFTGVQGINMMFNGDLDGYAWGGGACAVMDGARRCPRATWNPPWSFANLAPLAHEMGHGYGLPHSDNSDGDDDTYDNPWDVMSDGWRNAVADPVYGTRPKHINMIQRDRLGWVASARKWVVPDGLSGSWQFELEYAALADGTGRQLVVLNTPDQIDPAFTVSYTLEARNRAGAYEGGLAGTAVIVHRVRGGTAYSEDADFPPANVANNEGSMFKVGETWSSPNGGYRLRVDGATARGFLVTLTAGGQVTGGPLRPRTGTPPTSSQAPAAVGNHRISPRPALQRRAPFRDRRRIR